MLMIVKYLTRTSSSSSSTANPLSTISESVVFRLTAPDANITTGTIVALHAFPFEFTINTIRADVSTSPAGSSLIVDILRNGTSILNNKLTINPGKTSTVDSSPTPSFLNNGNKLFYGDKLSFQIIQIGSTTPGKFLIITLKGVRNANS